MPYIIYIIAKSKSFPLLIGLTKDIRKALEFHGKQPNINPYKLFYVELSEIKEDAAERFKLLNTLNREQKNKLIENQNEDWIEIIPGKHINI